MTPQTTAPWPHDPIGSAVPLPPGKRALASAGLGQPARQAGGETP